MKDRAISIATRGSALALAQANAVLAACHKKFPALKFELKIIKTTGDKLQKASLSRIDASLPRGLFTKELEEALLDHRADIAVHSLKDLPTELPAGLALGGVAGKRADARDVFIFRPIPGLKSKPRLADFPKGLTVGTSSTRRKAQLLASRPDFRVVEIRGNVPTRLQKLAEQPGLDAIVLAHAGLQRLNFKVTASSQLHGLGVPKNLRIIMLDLNEMLPCVGQAAIGLEIRADDERLEEICGGLNHRATLQSVLAERSFLRAMGGGCQSPVGAFAVVKHNKLRLRAISFLQNPPRRASASGAVDQAEALGQKVAAKLRG